MTGVVIIKIRSTTVTDLYFILKFSVKKSIPIFLPLNMYMLMNIAKAI